MSAGSLVFTLRCIDNATWEWYSNRLCGVPSLWIILGRTCHRLVPQGWVQNILLWILPGSYSKSSMSAQDKCSDCTRHPVDCDEIPLPENTEQLLSVPERALSASKYLLLASEESLSASKIPVSVVETPLPASEQPLSASAERKIWYLLRPLSHVHYCLSFDFLVTLLLKRESFPDFDAESLL